MAVVTGFTADRMLEMENATVISGTVNASGQLILMTKGGTVINAGIVKGTDATALLGIIDSSTVDLTLSGAGTPASPWQLSATVAISSTSTQGLVELATTAETVAGTDTARAVTPAGLQAAFDAGLASPTLRLSSTADVSPTTDGALVIGPTSAVNMTIDNNEIMARTNGAASTLNVNIEGGDVYIGSAASKVVVPGHLVMSGSNRQLWTGAYFMHETQTITLSEKVTDQANGIVLCWSYYSGGAAQNHTWTYDYIPKWHVINRPGEGVVCMAPQFTGNPATPGGVITKYIYIGDTSITGQTANDDNLGNTRVLRAVIGV